MSTDMENDNQIEIIDHIKEVIGKLDEPYQLGAWERFRKQKSQRRPFIFWKIGLSIAATLTAVIVSTWLILDSSPKTGADPSISNLENIYSNDTPSVFGNEKLDAVQKLEVEKEKVPKHESSTDGLNIAQQGLPKEEMESTINQVNTLEYIAPMVPMATDKSTVVVVERIPKGIPVFKPIASSANKNKSELQWGIAFSPTISTHESEPSIGIGGGVSTGWNLSKKITLGSGLYVSHNQLVYESMDQQVRSSSSSEVQVNLISMEIPINVQYHLSRNVFVSVGVSSTTFLKEQYSYNLEYEKLMAVPVLTESDEQITTFKIVKVEETQKISEPSFNRYNIAAFYIFSFGYQYDLSKRHQLSVEPFIKIPAMPINSRELQYSSGGVQLKVKF